MADYRKIIVQLRGEIGEIIHTWVLLRHFLATRSHEATGDIEKDMESQNLWFLNALIDKLENELISRLSELAEPVRRGRINFENAKSQMNHAGLDDCQCRIDAFRTFVKNQRFEEKRNREISHKEFVVDWKDERAPIHIPYRTLLRAVALAIRTIKRMDLVAYGDIHANYMWRELRKKRYTSTILPRAGYMIAEYIRLPEVDRARIIEREIREGRFHQESMDAEVNGVKVQVYASKKWGAINLGGHLMILEQYPLQSIQKIEGHNIVVDPAWKNTRTAESDGFAEGS